MSTQDVCDQAYAKRYARKALWGCNNGPNVRLVEVPYKLTQKLDSNNCSLPDASA
jgi:hypothetical protein